MSYLDKLDAPLRVQDKRIKREHPFVSDDCDYDVGVCGRSGSAGAPYRQDEFLVLDSCDYEVGFGQ